MCRLIAFSRRKRRNKALADLIDSLIKSAKKDPYQVRIGYPASHSDGWGYAVIGFSNGSPHTTYVQDNVTYLC